MRKTVFALVILAGLLFDLSLALQAEDLPETPYDESQGVACEHAPPLLTQVLQDSVQKTRPHWKAAPPSAFGSPARPGEFRVEKRNRQEQSVFGAATIHAVPLRC